MMWPGQRHQMENQVHIHQHVNILFFEDPNLLGVGKCATRSAILTVWKEHNAFQSTSVITHLVQEKLDP
jgi:hypothetical protein